MPKLAYESKCKLMKFQKEKSLPLFLETHFTDFKSVNELAKATAKG